MQTIFLILASVIAQAAPIPLVEQSVECISVAHMPDDIKLVFFWDRCAGMWTCLDHRWAAPSMAPSVTPSGVELAWLDEANSPTCYRVIRAPAYVETWERENPLAELNQRVWFRQLLNPGLKQPRRPQ